MVIFSLYLFFDKTTLNEARLLAKTCEF